MRLLELLQAKGKANLCHVPDLTAYKRKRLVKYKWIESEGGATSKSTSLIPNEQGQTNDSQTAHDSQI